MIGVSCRLGVHCISDDFPFCILHFAFCILHCVYPSFAKTHVSLLPPPCELLTTRLPRGKATRVRAPGTTMIFSPHSTNGRRSTCRPSSRPSTKVGCCDSVIVGWAM